MKTIGIIGGGNMGLAIISRLGGKRKIFVCEKDVKRAAFLKKKYKVSVCDVAQVACCADELILAVKPQDMEPILEQVKASLSRKTTVISIAAGVTTSFLEKKLGRGVRVVRTMPNMPAQIGEGITAIARGRFATERDLRIAIEIFKNVGEVVVVDEKRMDAVTAVSGSGPAYVFLFTECLLQAARKVGLNEDLARQLVTSTLLGSVHQMRWMKEEPAGLRAKVTSKGGTTQAALDVFERNRIRDIFVEALCAAKRRAGELARK